MFKAVLFDLDGTILNTNELIVDSFLYTLEKAGKTGFTRDHIIANFGRTLVDQLHEYTGEEDVEPYITMYRERNISRHDELIAEFPHVSEVLEQLGAHGVKMGVVTSKIRRTSIMGLDRFGLTSHMQSIVTVEDVTMPKPHQEGILRAIGELGVNPQETLMVGDSQYDILAAKNAGIPVAGVCWTAKGENFLKQFEPDYLIRDMQELLELCGIAK